MLCEKLVVRDTHYDGVDCIFSIDATVERYRNSRVLNTKFYEILYVNQNQEKKKSKENLQNQSTTNFLYSYNC